MGDVMKYLKWAFGTNVGHRKNEKFEIGKVITRDMWDPDNSDWDKRGGFNFTNEECALRWVSRGDTLYEVEVPSDAKIIEVKNDKTPRGIFVANKIILKNPKPVSEKLLLDFYNKSKLPLSTYFECIRILAYRGYYDLSLKIIKDKVDMSNIDFSIEKFSKSLRKEHNADYACYNKVKEVLEEIKSSVDINLFIDKEPYVKKISDDNVINLTGQSGAGKSYYANKAFSGNEYLIVDTDDIFSEDRFVNSSGINRELGEYFRKKHKKLPSLGNDFDLIYTEILDYCSNYDKIVVIDSALFHCIKDISLLKGTLIVLRTCIDKCYNRTISRFKSNNKDYNKEELEKFKEKKKAIYRWYKHLNLFLNEVNKMSFKNIKK